VDASGTSLTDIYGVGPVVAGLLIGYSGDIARFPTRHHYAAYNGTAPIDASSGTKKRHRLNPRGNRMLNHALHLIAITQLRYPNTEGRLFYERKLTEGKTKKEAIRTLKRRLSDVVYRHLQANQQTRLRPGGQPGTSLSRACPALHPESPALPLSHPGPPPSLRPHHRACRSGKTSQRAQDTP
jgi:hypothetical protein